MPAQTRPKKQNYFRSLSFRFMLMLVLIGIIPTIAVAAVIMRNYQKRAVQIRTNNVKNQFDVLSNLILTEGFLEQPDSDLLDSELTLISNVYNGRILIVDSTYRVIKDSFYLDNGKTSVSTEVISCFLNKKGSTYYDEKNAFIEITTPIIDNSYDEPKVMGVLVGSISTSEITQTVHFIEDQTIFAVGITSSLVLIFGFLLSHILVKPFRDVTRAIEDVTDGIEDEAISVPDYSETEQIIDAFNNMLSRVRALDNSRQEFVSNVSHELKTPLTSMKVLADSLNDSDDVPAEIYREFMSDITQEIDRENNIITSLLTMVRMDKKAGSMIYEKQDITALLEGIIKRLTPIAKKQGITVSMAPSPQVIADVDETKLSLAFSNLIENAIKYNKENGWVHVTLKADSKYFYVSVEDCGLGIPDNQIDYIFERFYRVDKSHSTAIEGTGLGLAITKSAISLHRGVIKVTSKLGEGTTFMVRIPLVKQD